jgi:hypothetical protein
MSGASKACQELVYGYGELITLPILCLSPSLTSAPAN